jgi:hypothetical protein
MEESPEHRCLSARNTLFTFNNSVKQPLEITFTKEVALLKDS